MSIATGLRPAELDDLDENDPAMFEAMRMAAADWWPTQTELAAAQVELLSALLRVTLSAAGVKENDLPPLVHIPRPDGMAAPKAKPVSGQDLGRWMRGRNNAS